MGLHMVAVAKFHLQLASHSLGPGIAGIVCPVALKLFLGLRVFHFREEAIYKARLFFFRLAHIAFNTEIPFANGTRLERALRLIGQTVITTTSTTPSHQQQQLSQDTLNTLSMLAL